MVELQSENWLTLAQAARMVPGKPHPATIWRWCRSGVNGVRLSFIKAGARIVVSERALVEFLERCTEADRQRHESVRAARLREREAAKIVRVKPATARRRAREIEAARESLRRQGIEC